MNKNSKKQKRKPEDDSEISIQHPAAAAAGGDGGACPSEVRSLSFSLTVMRKRCQLPRRLRVIMRLVSYYVHAATVVAAASSGA